MIKRLNMGLVAPREIGEFIHDKLRYVFLYIIFIVDSFYAYFRQN